jgi:hypothetical protein
LSSGGGDEFKKRGSKQGKQQEDKGDESVVLDGLEDCWFVFHELVVSLRQTMI